MAKSTVRHDPIEETRKLVKSLTAYGATQEDIARRIGISVDTLSRKYDHELKTGLSEANSVIAQSLFRKAKDGDTACMIFWLKTRARWRETGDEKPEAQTPTAIQFVRDNAH